MASVNFTDRVTWTWRLTTTASASPATWERGHRRARIAVAWLRIGSFADQECEDASAPGWLMSGVGE